MTSASSRSASPVDIDFSVIRTSIEMGHKMIDQILNGIHYGSDEVRNLLREECDFILECKVCRNLFRSFPNFVAHKRVYCMENFVERAEKANLAPVPGDEETVVIQPESPEDTRIDKSTETTSIKAPANIDKVINRTFEGKSKEYQFYTSVAEAVEKRKVTKVTNTVTLTPISTTSKAVGVTHSKGDKSAEIVQGSSSKKPSPVKPNGSKPSSPAKKKNSVLDICADLAKKQVLQGDKEQPSSSTCTVRVSTRSRKSSPRKSVEYLEDDMEISEWIEEPSSDDSKVASESDTVKDWMKFCDVKKFMCKLCRKSFSSLYNLKFHAKMKHVKSVKYTCPMCDSMFVYSSSLARHLRGVHHRTESYINNVKMRLQKIENEESMVTDQDEGSSSSSSVNSLSPDKITGGLLSYSTGWKKCDKCGKVCWKAKSFYRHYSTCKGSIKKDDSKSAPNSPLKLGKAVTDSSSQKNSTALLRLQEKLRAGIIQPTSNVESTLKTKQRDRNVKSESEQVNKDSDKKSMDSYSKTYPELLKTLTRPPDTNPEEPKSKPENTNESSQVKTYNLRATNQTSEEVKAEFGKINVNMMDTDKGKEMQSTNGSPAFKKLEERLVREAGLKEVQKPDKITETVCKPYGTRNASQSASSIFDTQETKETPWKGRNLFVEINQEDNLSKVKEQRVLRESPEIKELEEKLTREALGHQKQQDGKEVSGTVNNEEENKSKVDESINNRRKSLQNKNDQCIAEVKESEEHISEKTGKGSSRDADIRKRKISERMKERMTSQESANTDSKILSSRSVSREKDPKEEKLPEKTPEKMKLMTNFSPVSSPTTTPVLPSSPTPSLQSSSGDGYNMKFKMTVQEMAELVESASLTKFARERKKNARKILNTKQVKESQKVAAALSKPMKRRIKKRNIIIRNVYGTRNRTDSDLVSQKEKVVYSTRSAATEVGEADTGARTKMSSCPDSNVIKESIASQDLTSDEPTEKKRLSREQKRLLNSAGFVEKNFYAVTPSRDSSKDKSSRESSKERHSIGLSKEQLSNESVKEKPLPETSKHKSTQNVSTDRPLRDSSKEAPLVAASTESVEQEISQEKPLQSSSKDRGRTLRETSRGRPLSDSSSSSCTETEERKQEEVEPVATYSGKATSGSDSENTTSTFNSKENTSEEERVKQKKTVLYVGKDFTERIRNIQERKTDFKQENKAETVEHENSKERTNKRPEDSEGEKVVTLRSVSSVDRKRKVLSSGDISDSGSQSEGSIGEIQRKSRSLTQKINVKDVESELKETKKKPDTPKHRTRLATGSIFFDSELLKLSPTKYEKMATELSKNNDSNKGRLTKVSKVDSGLQQVKKRLSLSPQKETFGTKLEQSNEPRRYSLSTGVKQCQKCNKKFWKKKAYMYHMTNTPCAEKRNVKSGKKRALSLSPVSSLVTRGETSSDTCNKGNRKKAKTENRNPNKSNYEIENSEDQSDGNLREKAGAEEKSTDNLSQFEKEFNAFIKKRKAEDDETMAELDKQYNKNLECRKTLEKDKPMKTDPKRSIKSTKINEANAKDRDGKVVDDTSKLNKNVKSDIKDSDSVTMRKCLGEKDAKTEVNAACKEMNEGSNLKFQNNIEASRISASKKNPKNVSDLVTEKNKDTRKVQGENENAEKIAQSKNEECSNKTPVYDEIPGPSTSMSTVFSDDSDDNGSDFSGFSEDDLKTGEQDLSQIDIPEHEDFGDDLEDFESDDDLGDISDDIIFDEGDLDVKSGTASETVNPRPLRKSAQKRFAHVEEIWVYKEPGKPIVEKNKSVKNREYVIDLKNPSKLQCHSTKDVDRLIDEKNLKCRQCETPCTSVSNLRRHVIRHLGWKRYKCKHCAYTCYDMSYCRQHVLRAHDEKLTSKNFDRFILDLKKEATKKRSAKRTSTLHKSKLSSMDEDTYKKQKPPVPNKVGQNVNAEQTNTSESSKVPATTGSKSKTETSAIRGVEVNKVVVADFLGKTDVKKEHVKKEHVNARKEIPVRVRTVKTKQTPLDMARLNLFKALHDKQ